MGGLVVIQGKQVAKGVPVGQEHEHLLLSDIGAETHVGIQLAVVEKVYVLQFSPQGTALDQVDV